MAITPANFRKILSRARDRLANYMRDNCGLFDETNTCRCAKKTKGLVDMAAINPNNLAFATASPRKIHAFIRDHSNATSDPARDVITDLFRDQPFVETDAYPTRLRQIIEKLKG